MRTLMAGLVLSSLYLGACAVPGDDAAGDDASDFTAAQGGKADGNQLPTGEIFRFQIDHGAYPAVGTRPNVLVYVPYGFDPTGPLNVVVFLHGWLNCIDNVVGATNTACSIGGVRRQAYNLAGQLEVSGKNAILIVPELRYEQEASDPGALGQAGVFYDLIGDTLAKMRDQLGDDRIGELGKVIVASHSGGYMSAASIATRGGLPVDEIWLLDSLYGQTADFDGWVSAPASLPRIAAAPFAQRFASIYTGGGGTLANNQVMATRAAGWLETGVLDDRTTATLTVDDFGNGAIFKRSSLAHDDVPRYYLERLLASSLLPAKPSP